ncbi:MAG TPA: GMC family oxidoreductase [Microlunatus sp.]
MTDLSADYVVVGSGAGGGPLAMRLAAAGHSVIVIEAGVATGPGDLAYEVPGFHAYASEDETITWSYFVQHYDDPLQAERDPKYRAESGGVLYPRCATVGGCTAHNAMIIVRPNNADWEAIADLTGDASWRAKEMNGYFERLEHCLYVAPTPRLPPEWWLTRALSKIPLLRRFAASNGHGSQGWLPTSLANPLLLTRDIVLLWVVIKAASTQLKQLLGRRLHWQESIWGLVDPNDLRAQTQSMQGVWLIPQSVEKGHRVGTREALSAAATAPGSTLTILPDTLATRLVLDDTGRCRGVECLTGRHLYRAHTRPSDDAGSPVTVTAHREVILAGGAFNTPQLLQLSGIGPADELRRHHIDVRVDSRGVGSNLQDRYEVGVVTELKDKFTLVKGGLFRPPTPQDPPDPLLQEWQKGDGPYSSNGGLLAVMASSRPGLATPDLFLFALPADFRGYYPGYHKDLELKPNRLTWAVLKAHTKNRGGSVTLRSTDPRDTPDIRFRYFEEGTDTAGDDLDAVVAGVKLARRITGTLRRWGATELSPGPAASTDDQLRDFVRDSAWGHHACGTCAIGPDTDPSAVLDSRFRVRGVPGLRVVDASAFPTIPGYFLVSSVLMISEKAADVILADASAPPTPWPGPPPPNWQDRP